MEGAGSRPGGGPVGKGANEEGKRTDTGPLALRNWSSQDKKSRPNFLKVKIPESLLKASSQGSPTHPEPPKDGLPVTGEVQAPPVPKTDRKPFENPLTSKMEAPPSQRQ